MTTLTVSVQQISEAIINALTKNSVPLSGIGEGDACAECYICAQKCPEKVREILSAGASRITASNVNAPAVPNDIAQYIDHTLLKPEATPAEIEKLCNEAREFHFAAVCVNPPYVKQCAEILRGTDVKIAVVVGFPLGAHTTEAKVFETQQAIT
ncbi:MAG: hypothetical protein HY257_02405, partial [Chloroflexi bacterium]|nr:hypothetical protein [Chloroflexota bacterium]